MHSICDCRVGRITWTEWFEQKYRFLYGDTEMNGIKRILSKQWEKEKEAYGDLMAGLSVPLVFIIGMYCILTDENYRD